jgi:hypothetical protein
MSVGIVEKDESKKQYGFIIKKKNEIIQKNRLGYVTLCSTIVYCKRIDTMLRIMNPDNVSVTPQQFLELQQNIVMGIRIPILFILCKYNTASIFSVQDIQTYGSEEEQLKKHNKTFRVNYDVSVGRAFSIMNAETDIMTEREKYEIFRNFQKSFYEIF